MLSGRLDRFKRKSQDLFNFRCPFCLDSEKNKRKARGYVYSYNRKTLFHCHNCGRHWGFDKFLKQLNSNLYNQYKLELLKENSPQQYTKILEEKKESLSDIANDCFQKLTSINELSDKHHAKKYLLERRIPTQFLDELKYCEHFKDFINQIIPGKIEYDDERIIIPFFNRDKELIALQGRALNDNKVRYITIVFNKSTPVVFGMDKIDTTKKIYVFEGPFDSMFIENSIAIGGSFLNDVVNFENCVVVYDNEPRAPIIINKIDHAIDQGFDVCIWPPHIISKDVNEMVVNEKLSPNYIKWVIDKTTYRGLQAKLALEQWKKR